jgi:hypothetical protein
MPLAREDLDSNYTRLASCESAFNWELALVNMEGVEDMAELETQPQLHGRLS